MIRTLDSLVRNLNKVTYLVGALAISLMMIHVSVHVFCQYVLNAPLPGTILFVSNYYMVAVTFLCLAAVELKGGHISVDVIFCFFPRRLQSVCTGIGLIITIVVFVLLTWQSFNVAQSRRVAGSFEVEYGYRILTWPSFYLVPVGSALFAFTSLVKLLALIMGQAGPATSDRSIS